VDVGALVAVRQELEQGAHAGPDGECRDEFERPPSAISRSHGVPGIGHEATQAVVLEDMVACEPVRCQSGAGMYCLAVIRGCLPSGFPVRGSVLELGQSVCFRWRCLWRLGGLD
jgi:hypothetical protein